MILYFSGTGNSRYIALALSSITGDEAISLSDYIRDKKRGNFHSEAPFVFVTPTYAWRMPKIVYDYIAECQFSGNDRAYFVQTYGDKIFDSARYCKKLCQKVGLRYMGFSKVKMPQNYIVMFKVLTPEKSDELISKSETQLKQLGSLIKSGKTLEQKPSMPFAMFMSSVVNPVFCSILSDKGFRVTEDCVGCGNCARVCPLGNISLKDGVPIWNGKCTHCMACICSCPKAAIEYKNTTVGKRRYLNTREPEF